MTDDLLLPPGTRLVHIGPQKTGTTALQGALMLARPQLARHGVVYPGRWRQHALAARAMTGAPGPRGHSRGSMREWRSLVREVTAAGDDRVIVSAEAFSMADLSTATTVVERLGGDRVHVLVTFDRSPRSCRRPGSSTCGPDLSVSYRRWLRGMLSEAPYDRPTPELLAAPSPRPAGGALGLDRRARAGHRPGAGRLRPRPPDAHRRAAGWVARRSPEARAAVAPTGRSPTPRSSWYVRSTPKPGARVGPTRSTGATCRTG